MLSNLFEKKPKKLEIVEIGDWVENDVLQSVVSISGGNFVVSGFVSFPEGSDNVNVRVQIVGILVDDKPIRNVTNGNSVVMLFRGSKEKLRKLVVGMEGE